MLTFNALRVDNIIMKFLAFCFLLFFFQKFFLKKKKKKEEKYPRSIVSKF